MKNIYLVLVLLLTISCSNDDPAIKSKVGFPTDISLEAAEIRIGDVLTIRGKDFRSEEKYIVKFQKDVKGDIIELGDNMLKVKVPEKAQSGDITLIHEGVTKVIGEIIVRKELKNEGKGLLLVWDHKSPVIYQIKEVDLTTGELKDIGESSLGMMKSYYDLDEIYYNQKDNQVVALHDNKSLWIYDINTQKDRLINLDFENKPNYRDFVIAGNKAFLLVWDHKSPVIYQIKEVNLRNGELKDVGQSSLGMMKSYYDLDEIYYNQKQNQIIALHDNKSLWIYDLNTQKDRLITLDFENKPTYKDFVVAGDRAFLLVWDNKNPVIYQIKEVNLATGELKNIGQSSLGMMADSYNLDEIYYNLKGNQIIALHDEKSLWIYDIDAKKDRIISLDFENKPNYRDFVLSYSGGL